MLEAKKQEVQGDLSRSMDYAQMAEKTAEERKRIREEKQRQARQQAIQVRAEPRGKKDVALEMKWINLRFLCIRVKEKAISFFDLCRCSMESNIDIKLNYL